MRMDRTRRGRLLLLLALAAAASQTTVAQAQIQYQQDLQFPDPNANFYFQEVSWLTVAAYGNIYLLQRAAPGVSVWSSEGALLRTWPTDDLQDPHSLRIEQPIGGAPRIWITDMVQAFQAKPPAGCVKAYSESGERLAAIGLCGKPGSGLDPLQFDKVTDIAIDALGNRWISDGDLGGLNNRVVQVDITGKLLQVWSAPGNQPGSGLGEFNLPHALDIDNCDRVFIADTLNHRVQVIRTDGTFQQQLQCFGTDGVYGLRLSKASTPGGPFLATTSSPTSNPSGGTVRLFPIAQSCTAPVPVPDGCATAAQWNITLPPAPSTAILHSIDVGANGGLYIATLGGNLPPQRWIPADASRSGNSSDGPNRHQKEK